MSLTRPRLSRSVPFWVLIVGSVLALAGGTYLLVSKLDTMAKTLTDGTATGVEVYAGQIWAVLGAIIAGAGLIGLALALTLGALSTFASAAASDVADAPVWEEEVVEVVAVPVDSAAADEPAAETPAAHVETPGADETREPAADTAASEPAIDFGDPASPRSGDSTTR